MMYVYLLTFITVVTTIADVECRTSEITRNALIERKSKQTGRSLLSTLRIVGYLKESMPGDSEIAGLGSFVSVMRIANPLDNTALCNRIGFLQQPRIHYALTFYCKICHLNEFRMLTHDVTHPPGIIRTSNTIQSVSTAFECRILYLVLGLLYWNAMFNILYIYIYITFDKEVNLNLLPTNCT